MCPGQPLIEPKRRSARAPYPAAALTPYLPFEPDGGYGRPHGMQKVIFLTLRFFAPALLAAVISGAGAATPEDRYVAARDVAIEQLSAIYDAGKFDDAAQKVEDAATTDLTAQMGAILHEAARDGFGPAQLNLGSFYKGDEGFGTLDGLRFDALAGKNGEKAGANGADGKYVEPKAKIVVTTQTMFETWLRAHKDWWGKNIKNVPQQMAKALSDESFYTQAISNGSAVVKFASLPITKSAGATFAFAMLAGRTQSEIPDAADEVIVAAIANGKVYVAEGSIAPEVKITACSALRASYNKKAEQASSRSQGDLREQGEDAFERCFTERASREPALVAAIRQAQALLAEAIGK
jgi:hypothetical protein